MSSWSSPLRPSPRSSATTRSRAAGWAWASKAGWSCSTTWRATPSRRWQPQAGAYLLYLGGELARTIDHQGRLAAHPVALLAGVAPLRFRLDQGWVSFLSARAGAPLGNAGHPPLALSVTLFEVGRAF